MEDKKKKRIFETYNLYFKCIYNLYTYENVKYISFRFFKMELNNTHRIEEI